MVLPPECRRSPTPARAGDPRPTGTNHSPVSTRHAADDDLTRDLVRGDFTAHGPNWLWGTDLTVIPTGEGPLGLSAIRDAFSRRVVARETSAHADADLVPTSLEYALASREVTPVSSSATPATAVNTRP
ncbi:DDE-type integrase/transposase/recombinase [Streptomyces sp. NPDC056061]|uniref:DDE-type integrase/transposase/recombinase n=1 Tax=Streptomyces sp. NPDC056061 TaxID=3345700 RepID=UPI0035E24A14